jgi:hypothetical protein
VDHLVSSSQQRFRDGEPESLRGLEIDDQINFGDLLYRQVGGLGAGNAGSARTPYNAANAPYRPQGRLLNSATPTGSHGLWAGCRCLMTLLPLRLGAGRMDDPGHRGHCACGSGMIVEKTIVLRLDRPVTLASRILKPFQI